MALVLSGSSSSDVKCSICWEDVSQSCGRSIVSLICSHMFHLDCIGSAFNASGVMQCPNCRVVENGVWRRFGGGNIHTPDQNTHTHEESMDPDIHEIHEIEDEEYDEDDHQFTDVHPHEVYLCPFHAGSGVLPSNGSQNIVEQHAVFPQNLPSNGFQNMVERHAIVPQNSPFNGSQNMVEQHPVVPQNSPSDGSQNIIEQHAVFPQDPNINHWSEQTVVTQISATHFIHDLYQPAMVTSMSNHITGANQASVPSETLTNAHNNPDGIPNLESVGHRVILQPGGNGPVYNNLQHMQPPRNSPSPVVRAMFCARNESNGLPGGLPAGNVTSLPEHTATFFHVPPLSLSTQTQNHPQATFVVHHHVEERGPLAPSEHLPEDFGPYWGMFN